MPVRPYEVVYIIDPDVNAEDSQAVVERFRALAETQGAQDLRVDTSTLGRRRLAYEINHKREGQYVVMDFQSEAAAPAEVERVLNITDSILRSMVVRLDEMPPEPTAPAPAAAPAAQPAPAAQAAPAAPAAEAPATEAPAEEAPVETLTAEEAAVPAETVAAAEAVPAEAPTEAAEGTEGTEGTESAEATPAE